MRRPSGLDALEQLANFRKRPDLREILALEQLASKRLDPILQRVESVGGHEDGKQLIAAFPYLRTDLIERHRDPEMRERLLPRPGMEVDRID